MHNTTKPQTALPTLTKLQHCCIYQHCKTFWKPHQNFCFGLIITLKPTFTKLVNYHWWSHYRRENVENQVPLRISCSSYYFFRKWVQNSYITFFQIWNFHKRGEVVIKVSGWQILEKKEKGGRILLRTREY